jgi:hypothetical protein
VAEAGASLIADRFCAASRREQADKPAFALVGRLVKLEIMDLSIILEEKSSLRKRIGEVFSSFSWSG